MLFLVGKYSYFDLTGGESVRNESLRDLLDVHISIYHPKSLLQSALLKSSNKLSKFSALIGFIPFRETFVGDLTEEMNCQLRRNDNPDALDESSGLNMKLATLFEDTTSWKSIFSSYQTESASSMVRGGLVEIGTIHCPLLELAKVSVVSKIVEIAQLTFDAFSLKFISLLESAKQSRLNKRQEASLFKLLGMIDLFVEAFRSIFLLCELELFTSESKTLNEGTNRQKGNPTIAQKHNIKALEKLLGALLRFQTKLGQFEWEAALQEFSKSVSPFLSSKANSKKAE